MIKLSPDQLGICSWSTRPTDGHDLADRIIQLGLKKVQFHLKEEGLAWVPTLQQQGITIVSGMFGTKGENYSTLETIRQTGGVIQDQFWPDNWKTVQWTAKAAGDLGLKIVSFHAGFLPHDPKDPTFAKLQDRIGQIAGAFAQSGVTVIFETGQETADTLSQFLTQLHQIGHTNTGVNFDPANMILYNMGDPIASLKKLMPFVKQVHIKDAIRTTTPGQWGKEVAIGDGQVDWKAFLQVLAENDYSGNMVIEREAGADRVGDVRKAIERITALM